MGGQKRNMPSHKRIVAANAALIATLPKIRGKNPHRTCWACGDFWEDEGNPIRAHVHARANGGSDDASNMFLLCQYCHEGQPDGASRDAQIRWLRSQPAVEDRRERQRRAIVDILQRYAVPDQAEWLDDVSRQIVASFKRNTCTARGLFEGMLAAVEDEVCKRMEAPDDQ